MRKTSSLTQIAASSLGAFMRMSLSVLVLTLLTSVPTFAHDDHHDAGEGSRWLKLSADLPFALFGVYIAKAEFKIGERVSVTTNAGYLDTRISIKPTINSFKFGNENLIGVKIGGGLRWYPLKGCMDGVFFEDMVESDVLWTTSGNAATFGNFTFGPVAWVIFNSFHIGYSWVTDIGFFVDAAAGIRIEAPLAGIPTDVYKLTFHDTIMSEGMNKIEARLAVGWAF